MNLPELSAEEAAQQQAMMALLEEEIRKAGGALPFDRYMELALYAPGLGYYVSGAHKFGEGGDFVTAPEISPLFGRCLAHPCLEVFESTGTWQILEFGAGTGVMAAQILAELQRLHPDRPVSYRILELSLELQQRQRQTLQSRVPELMKHVSWVREVPRDFSGMVLANEVLDAMPVHLFRRGDQKVEEQVVGVQEGQLSLQWRSAGVELTEAVAAIEKETGKLQPGYVSEVNLRLAPWLQMLSERLPQAVVLLIDYGYTRKEYYHPQRSMGTLICHYRHQVHDDVLLRPGLQDITASVDFTAVAEAAEDAGLKLLGFSSQANVLLGCGLENLLSELDPEDVEQHMTVMQGVKQLILPTAMGERFKAIALSKGVASRLSGFSA
ncbi:class I SAM-dependent methyltransferase [Thiolapillus sp.]|uniref:class I SAM-dependent methyltransferase n=1 Tax=Thiolapillus sp. TaxID=2017437 RepID=UPI003AF70147